MKSNSASVIPAWSVSIWRDVAGHERQFYCWIFYASTVSKWHGVACRYLYQTTRKQSPELCLLNKGVFEFYTRSAKIIDVAGYHCQVVNQCNRGNLFAYRMFGVW